MMTCFHYYDQPLIDAQIVKQHMYSSNNRLYMLLQWMFIILKYLGTNNLFQYFPQSFNVNEILCFYHIVYNQIVKVFITTIESHVESLNPWFSYLMRSLFIPHWLCGKFVIYHLRMVDILNCSHISHRSARSLFFLHFYHVQTMLIESNLYRKCFKTGVPLTFFFFC